MSQREGRPITTTPTIDLDAILALPPDQRIAIADAIWDSLTDEAPITPAMAAELDRRLAEHRADPTNVIPWEEIEREIEQEEVADLKD